MMATMSVSSFVYGLSPACDLLSTVYRPLLLLQWFSSSKAQFHPELVEGYIPLRSNHFQCSFTSSPEPAEGPTSFILLRPSSIVTRLFSAFRVCLHLLVYNSTVLCLNCFYARKTRIKVPNNLKNIIFCIRIQNLLLVILRF